MTKFLAWMTANNFFSKARDLTYSQFPMKFVWKEYLHQYEPPKIGFSMGRVHIEPPCSGEIFYLRTHLNHVKGHTSFDELKKVDNIKHNSFKEACFAMSLLDDDKEYIKAIKETRLRGS